MNNKILVAYASRCGSTGEVAEVIGQVLRGNNSNAVVDVRRAQDVIDVKPYRAAVVGSAIRFGRCLPEAVQFVKTYENMLSRMPVAYFLVCGTLKDDTPENRRETREYLDAMRKYAPGITPVSAEAFAGKLVPNTLPLPQVVRLLMKLTHARTGDWRNWQTIRVWAADLRRTFSN